MEILQHGSLEELMNLLTWPARDRRPSGSGAPRSPMGCSPEPRWDPPRVTPACRCLRRQGRGLSLRTLPARARGYSPSCLLLALGAQQQLSNRELWATASGLAPAVSYSGSRSLCLSGVPGQHCLGQCREWLRGFLLVFLKKMFPSFSAQAR